MTLRAKMTMPDSQLYPWSLYMTHNVEDIIVFLGLKHVFNSDHYYMFSCGRNAQVTNKKLKIIGFQNYKHWYIMPSVNWMEGHLKIRWEVPLQSTSVCLNDCLIITQEPLDRFPLNFDWVSWKTHGNVPKLVKYSEKLIRLQETCDIKQFNKKTIHRQRKISFLKWQFIDREKLVFFQDNS